jgi:hypothetical protein
MKLKTEKEKQKTEHLLKTKNMSTEIENKSLEVFGTTEVAVKEFMGSTDKSLVLLSDYELAKKNLEQLKVKHQPRVDELVALEVLTSAELKELNSIRGELREPRYLVQNIEKNNISVFEAYKKTDKAKLKDLIDINKDLEDKASDKIKLENDRKKDEKEAKAKAEELRIAKIKSKIETFESDCYIIIQSSTIHNVEENKSKLDFLVNEEFDYEEYDILFDVARNRVQSSWDLKCNDITTRENQRLENEAMKQEIFQVRVNRLKEVGFDLHNGVFMDTILSTAIQESFILDCNSQTFEETLLDIKFRLDKKEQEAREVEIKNQKEEQFKVRRNRLAEIGFKWIGHNQEFVCKELGLNLYGDSIADADIFGFEEMLSKAKQDVVDAEKKREQDELDLQEKRKQEAKDKKQKELDDKARVKRLAKDKESIKNALTLIKETVIGEIVFRKYDNEETESFRAKLEVDFDKFIDECSNQLNEL